MKWIVILATEQKWEVRGYYTITISLENYTKNMSDKHFKNKLCNSTHSIKHDGLVIVKFIRISTYKKKIIS